MRHAQEEGRTDGEAGDDGEMGIDDHQGVPGGESVRSKVVRDPRGRWDGLSWHPARSGQLYLMEANDNADGAFAKQLLPHRISK